MSKQQAQDALTLKVSKADLVASTDVVYNDLDDPSINGLDIHSGDRATHGIDKIVTDTAAEFNAVRLAMIDKIGIDYAELADKLSTTGDTATGTIEVATNVEQVVLDGAASDNRSIIAQTNGLKRFSFDVANDDPETGANAGSNLSVTRYNDAGAQAGRPFSIERATGKVSVSRLKIGDGAEQGGSGPDIRLQPTIPTDNLQIGTTWLTQDVPPDYVETSIWGEPVEITNRQFHFPFKTTNSWTTNMYSTDYRTKQIKLLPVSGNKMLAIIVQDRPVERYVSVPYPFKIIHFVLLQTNGTEISILNRKTYQLPNWVTSCYQASDNYHANLVLVAKSSTADEFFVAKIDQTSWASYMGAPTPPSIVIDGGFVGSNTTTNRNSAAITLMKVSVSGNSITFNWTKTYGAPWTAAGSVSIKSLHHIPENGTVILTGTTTGGSSTAGNICQYMWSFNASTGASGTILKNNALTNAGAPGLYFYTYRAHTNGYKIAFELINQYGGSMPGYYNRGTLYPTMSFESTTQQYTIDGDPNAKISFPYVLSKNGIAIDLMSPSSFQATAKGWYDRTSYRLTRATVDSNGDLSLVSEATPLKETFGPSYDYLVANGWDSLAEPRSFIPGNTGTLYPDKVDPIVEPDGTISAIVDTVSPTRGPRLSLIRGIGQDVSKAFDVSDSTKWLDCPNTYYKNNILNAVEGTTVLSNVLSTGIVMNGIVYGMFAQLDHHVNDFSGAGRTFVVAIPVLEAA